MKDKISIDRLNKLHPTVRNTFRMFIEDAERDLNITLRITQGLRTIAEQNALYAQGRTTKGKIVTNAKGGSSYHNYGLAIDVVEMKGNTANWDFDYSLLKPIADKHGIVWGGTFKSIIDKPHFEISKGYKPSQLANIAKDKYGYPMV
jgi:LAS superfamily LD-carboxypeptidase LdcB